MSPAQTAGTCTEATAVPNGGMSKWSTEPVCTMNTPFDGSWVTAKFLPSFGQIHHDLESKAGGVVVSIMTGKRQPDPHDSSRVLGTPEPEDEVQIHLQYQDSLELSCVRRRFELVQYTDSRVEEGARSGHNQQLEATCVDPCAQTRVGSDGTRKQALSRCRPNQEIVMTSYKGKLFVDDTETPRTTMSRNVYYTTTTRYHRLQIGLCRAVGP
ncbi:hypothetical protein CONLIGDRAFT_648948 [Coniochaeta ligniaria NRRL 30616]|uniref:Uncharacterized protein n=1 Tax=Coniochaeta ligniaria NRRL 30616 TaxID=1408157 RepID=A0A1J7J9E8_9PEZI|nr:hypothetical protein CONLIGDRAFT_648948 [Coniochaeta ligniaria NRRL 30616]